jgi:uncharacterized protein YecE (DUF72 family)
MNEVRVGCAGWSIPKAHASHFPETGSHLSRYAQRFRAVEINSSFYRPHRPSTYARWAEETPERFEFAIKMPREITHGRRLTDATDPLDRFLAETEELGAKRGPLLVQLPPSLTFRDQTVGAFFEALRQRYDGLLACEPRHPSWFAPEVESRLRGFKVARVAADPAVVTQAAEPGGWDGLSYYRLHGSPQIYYSEYQPAYLDALTKRLAEAAATAPTWCIFDNTAEGAATEDALTVTRQLENSFMSE